MEVTTILSGAYFLAINAAGLFLMAQDKLVSRRDNQSQRYSEGLFFFLAIIGGSLGVYAGMILFRHKTQKLYFFLGLPILTIQQLLLLYSYYLFFF